MKRSLVCAALCGVLASSGPPASAAVTVNDLKGATLVSPEVILVFWGDWSGCCGDLWSQQIVGATQHLLHGPYLSMLNEYRNAGYARLFNQVFFLSDKPDPTTRTFNNADITTRLAKGIADGTLPKPRVDGNDIYMVLVNDATHDPADPDAMGNFTGWHGWVDGPNKKNSYAWAWTVGDKSMTSPASHMAVLSHELVEAITDPGSTSFRVTGCGTTCTEIADACENGMNGGTTPIVNGYAVESYWSRALNRCIAPTAWDKVTRFTGSGWVQIFAGVRQIAEGGMGIAIADLQDNTRFSSDGGSTWTFTGGPPAGLLAVGGSALAQMTRDGAEILKWSGTPNQWTRIGAAPVEIYAGGGSTLYATLEDGASVNKWSGTPDSWTKIGGPGNQFAASKDTIWGVSPNQTGLMRYNGSNWSMVDSSGIGWKEIVSSSASTTIGGVAPNNGIFSIVSDVTHIPTVLSRTLSAGVNIAVTGSKPDVFRLTLDRTAVMRANDPSVIDTSWTKVGGTASKIFGHGGSVVVAANVCEASVNIKTDAANCGRCGHNCQGGSCTNGVCQPVTIASFVGLAGGGGLALDATSVYFTIDRGQVMKVNKNGTGLTTLASGQTSPWATAVDATSVYWVNSHANGEVRKMSKNGGGVTTLASNQEQPLAIAVDGSSVYWATGTPGTGSIKKTGLNGGAEIVLSGGERQPSILALDDGSIYWANFGTNETVNKMNKDGSGYKFLAFGQTGVYGLAVDQTNLYWSDQNSVKRMPKGGGSQTVLASGQSAPLFVTVDLSSNQLYWTNNVSGGDAVTVHQSLFGLNPPISIATGQTLPYLGAVDDTSFYFATNDGKIKRLAK